MVTTRRVLRLLAAAVLFAVTAMPAWTTGLVEKEPDPVESPAASDETDEPAEEPAEEPEPEPAEEPEPEPAGEPEPAQESEPSTDGSTDEPLAVGPQPEVVDAPAEVDDETADFEAWTESPVTGGEFIPSVTYPDTLFMPVGPRVLAGIDLEDFLAGVQADRRLLAELRKPVPDSRVDAVRFLKQLKSLAEKSDPIRLAMAVNRVLEQAPIYFDWLETEFESQQEELYEYYVGGAQGFSRAFEDFQNAVLMTAVNRLDTASRIIQESYSAVE